MVPEHRAKDRKLGSEKEGVQLISSELSDLHHLHSQTTDKAEAGQEQASNCSYQNILNIS